MCTARGYQINLQVLMQLYCVVGRIDALASHWDVTTTQGVVRGYYKPNPPYFTFLGVPYARPPIGYDRFKAPKPPLQWDGIFEATYQVRCPQADYKGTENCLVVNVFVPATNQTNMPVLVYFHDGHFQSGWGSFQPPPHLINQGIIIVTFNSRIGLSGFLCLRSQEIPGNAGLKDQVAALYWVNRNIAMFRGNQLDITVYGTGSGAVSIEIILLFGASEGLHQKAILESGSVLSPSSMTYNPNDVALEAAIELGYQGGENIKDLEDFFVELSILKLLNNSIMFLPCVERGSDYSLVNSDPLEILKSGKFLHIPMMIIYSDSKEMEIITNNKRFNIVPDNFEQLLPNNLDIDTGLRQKVGKLTKDFYFSDSVLHGDMIQSYTNYVNDVFMEYPSVKIAAYFSYNNDHPVFLMKFTYKLRSGDTSSSLGSNYGEVFQYVFSNRVDSNPVAHILRTLWSNFIKIGDPTPITTVLIPVVWIPVTSTITEGKINFRKISYLHFGPKIQNKEISTQQFTFWEQIYINFYKHYSVS